MLHWCGDEASNTVIRLSGFGRGVEPGSATELLDLMGTCMEFERNAEIFAEDDPAEYLYKVVSGAVRTCKLMSDGRRHIGAFYLPGDVFGLEAGEFHRFSAEALRGCKLRIVKKSRLLAR